MGLLDQVIGSVLGGSRQEADPQSGAAGMSPLVKALLLALAAKAAQSYLQQRGAGSAAPSGAAPGGGLGDILGSVLGGGGSSGGLGGGLGSILSGLGGAGGLGVLLDQLKRAGHGDAVNSWVGPGANQPIAPNALGDALGADTVDELQQHTGMPREALLSELATELPEAVSHITPNGRLPTDEELAASG
jgi:uncharacterized protein YidB (DUF937 family)